ncbi:hypothetical protein Cob_v004122 [Colletotrichum orbiculare MAFF 240422]|uniref:Uncharacterized protein n=1 Tax=Colletotrichum orbiculare (strain 104-T / ATCC 96160 / CBS 514.97 / LARS 414 / MAFF 240422) TaxID=1213857 RepID=A0A484FY18_COLOR|nr:hypothetical protein Cob_v004122 [Colletotrichum orbiculare MAFF 240422]
MEGLEESGRPREKSTSPDTTLISRRVLEASNSQRRALTANVDKGDTTAAMLLASHLLSLTPRAVQAETAWISVTQQRGVRWVGIPPAKQQRTHLLARKADVDSPKSTN